MEQQVEVQTPCNKVPQHPMPTCVQDPIAALSTRARVQLMVVTPLSEPG